MMMFPKYKIDKIGFHHVRGKNKKYQGFIVAKYLNVWIMKQGPNFLKGTMKWLPPAI